MAHLINNVFALHATLRRRNSGRLPCLSGLRGILAVWVMLSHTTSDGFGPLRLLGKGWLAVDVFFVMSGFLLMYTHEDDFSAIRLPAVSSFLWLRFWRTMPALLAASLLALAISGLAFDVWPTATAFMSDLISIKSWYIPSIRRVINAPFWSLHVEWLGYLIFPFLCCALLRIKRANLALLGIAVVLGGQRLILWAAGAPLMDAISDPFAVVRMAGGFTTGCLLWIAWRGDALPWLRGDLFAIAIVVSAIAVGWIGGEECLPLFLVLAVVVALRPGPLMTSMLDNPASQFLGRISYSLYLVHYPIVRLCTVPLQSAAPAIPHWLATGLAIGLSFAVASAVCMYWEEPMRKFGRRSLMWRAPAPAIAAYD